MVLSRADSNLALRHRQDYFRFLNDFVRSGTLVFVGYGFGDRIVFDIMDDLVGLHGADRLPWSYALFRDFELAKDEKLLHKCSRRRIIPVNCSFEEFFSLLETHRDRPTEVRDEGRVVLKIKGHSLEISLPDYQQYVELFEIPHEGTIHEEPKRADDFFLGLDPTWGPYNQGWDLGAKCTCTRPTWGRSESVQPLKSLVFGDLSKMSILENKVILIRGMPGVGKTTLLRRLAYDVYRSGEAPVFLMKSERTTFDYKLIATLIENLNYQLASKMPDNRRIAPVKPLILIDDAASVIRHVSGLRRLSNSERKAGTGRSCGALGRVEPNMATISVQSAGKTYFHNS